MGKRKSKKGRKKTPEKSEGQQGQDSQDALASSSATPTLEVQGIDNNYCSESVQRNEAVIELPINELQELKISAISQNAEQKEPLEKCEQEEEPKVLKVVLVKTRPEAAAQQASLLVKNELEDYRVECIAPNCTKEAAVKCPACSRLLYCTSKHLKVYGKEHECLPYRFLEKPRLGRYMIAAQEITTYGYIILRDLPVVTFPLSENYREPFSENYCIRCYRMYPDDTNLTQQCQCKLHVCDSTQTCRQITNSPRSMNHSSGECAAISSTSLEGLRLNDIALALFRLMNSSQKETLANDLMIKATYLKIPAPPPTFLKKIGIIKSLLPPPIHILHSDEEAFTLETCIKRFGRNVAPNSAHIDYQINAMIPRWTKFIYNKASHVLHSCMPNTVFDYTLQGEVKLRAIKKIAKGEIIYASYDNKLLFSPAYHRYNMLLQNYSYQCSCKRCRSVSELDTYFSSFPCPKCKPQKFIVSQESYVADWKCQKCTFTVTAASMERYMARTWNHIERKKSPEEIVKALEFMIEENYFHWNNFLAFSESIRLFEELYKMMELNDIPTINFYSASRGLKFLNAAKAVINITSIFMPYDYMPCHVLPLRLSGVIKIRELIDQLDQGCIDLKQVDTIIRGLYYRTEDLYSSPLYDLHLGTPFQEWNVCVLELKVLKIIRDVVSSKYGDIMTVKGMAPYLMRMFSDKVNKNPALLAEIEVKSSSPLFPFNLLV